MTAIPHPNYLGIMMKYFVCKLQLEVFDRDGAANSANEVINDIKIYFGHSEHELLIEPYICLIHKNFDELTQNPKKSDFEKGSAGPASGIESRLVGSVLD